MLPLAAAFAIQMASVPTGGPAPTPPAAARELSPEDELVQLQTVYRESCESRAYGTFDDVCTNLSDQIAAYRRQMRRDQSRDDKARRREHTRDVSLPPA